MRAVVQRVTEACVLVDGAQIARIGPGLLVLAGFGHGDGDAQVLAMARKVAGLRVFPDAAGRFQFDVTQTNGAVLAIPNFTLYGDTRRGRRPDFTAALPPVDASGLFDGFVRALGRSGISMVAAGSFGADMRVSLVNDGPVTLWIEQ